MLILSNHTKTVDLGLEYAALALKMTYTVLNATRNSAKISAYASSCLPFTVLIFLLLIIIAICIITNPLNRTLNVQRSAYFAAEPLDAMNYKPATGTSFVRSARSSARSAYRSANSSFRRGYNLKETYRTSSSRSYSKARQLPLTAWNSTCLMDVADSNVSLPMITISKADSRGTLTGDAGFGIGIRNSASAPENFI